MIHQEFTLTDNRSWQALAAFCKQFAPQCVAENRPLRVIVVDQEADRLEVQIRAYWWMLGQIAEQVWIGEKPRRQYSKETWHHYFASKYLPQREIELPTGHVHLERQSVAKGKIGVRAMDEYKNQVEAEAVAEMGVHLPARVE